MKLLNLEEEVRKIIENEYRLRSDIDNRWICMLSDDKHPDRRHVTPEWLGEIDFKCYGEYLPLGLETLNFRIYADALREFGYVIFTEDMITGKTYSKQTNRIVKILVDEYGLRNVTNEFAKQAAIRLNKNIDKHDKILY